MARPARSPRGRRPGATSILARKETPTSYHLSVVVDDALQGVSESCAARTCFTPPSVHRLLQALLGLPEPAYRHHRLIRDADGRKLSKSDRSTGLRELRAAGAHARRYPHVRGIRLSFSGG